MIMKSGQCPVCHSKLQINRLSCPNCMAEYPVNEALSPYDYLAEAQSEFLAIFLKCRGNLKSAGEQMGLSYPAVKRRLDLLLAALGYAKETENDMEEIDMSSFGAIDYKSVKASDIVRRKLYEHNGTATISLLDGKLCRITASRDGTFFTSDKLASSKYEFRVFDVIVDLLLSSDGGRAPKGNGHGKEDKVGYGKCTPDTILGAIAIQYSQKSFGESTFDPVFVLAAVLDWAGIAKNRRGYVELTPEYRTIRKDV